MGDEFCVHSTLVLKILQNRFKNNVLCLNRVCQRYVRNYFGVELPQRRPHRRDNPSSTRGPLRAEGQRWSTQTATGGLQRRALDEAAPPVTAHTGPGAPLDDLGGRLPVFHVGPPASVRRRGVVSESVHSGETECTGRDGGGRTPGRCESVLGVRVVLGDATEEPKSRVEDGAECRK